MRRLTDAAIERFNGWLGSERGFVQAVAVSLAWNVAVLLGWDRHGFAYLYAATEIGLVTQFTLAIIGRRSGAKVDRALAQIDQVVDDVYVVAQSLLKLAERDLHMQDALVAQTEALAAAISELRKR